MKKFVVHNPYDDKPIGSLAYMDYDEILTKLNDAYQIFSDKENWLKPYQRIEILSNFLELLKKNKLEIIRQAVLEGGKPFFDTKVEMERAINSVEIALNYIYDLNGKEIPMGITSRTDHRTAFTFKEPIGVVFGISAFNHPINLIIHQVISAIASNCPVLIKPATKTPFTCIKLIELLKQTSLPEKWCQLILCDKEVVSKILRDPRIGHLSFIGSADVGWKLRSQLSEGTTCNLEHGGVAPTIICEDADIENLIPLIIKGGFYHSGQVCVSIQRVFIHNDIIEEVSKKLIRLTKKLLIGDPQDEEKRIEIGPLITPENVERVDDWVKSAIEAGGELLCGGKKISNTFYQPTIILNPPDDAQITQEEVFGPVICLYTYKDRNNAIKRANKLPFSFQASVFTKNLNIALDTVKKIEATAVMINDHTAFRTDWMPFGGRRKSGLGFGGIINNMLNLTFEKLVVIKSNNL